MKNFIIGALIIGVAIVVGFVMSNKAVQYGVSAGPEHYNTEYFYGGLVQGGGIVTKTSNSTTSWSASDICNNSVIKWAPSMDSGSTTFASAATIIQTCLPKDGDFKDIIYWNIGAAASNTHFTAGTGMTIFYPEATGADLVVAGLNLARIRFLRATSSGIFMMIDEELVQ